jgi:polar amino acid transport system substrate-binding protein
MGLLRSTFLVLVSTLLAMTASADERTVVRFGTDAAYPPMTYLDEHNRFQGFEVDIANALCARMNVKCEFVQENWDDMIPALLANRFDAIMASMSITEERKKQIAFSKRYYQTPAIFTARKSTNLRNTSPEAMKGRVIGCQVDTIHVRYLEDVYVPAGATVKVYASQNEAQLELARGRLDAIMTDKVAVFEWLEKSQLGKCCAYAGQDLTDPKYIGEGVGFGLRKEDLELKDRIDDAIDAIVADGTYKKINDKYFPFSVY